MIKTSILSLIATLIVHTAAMASDVAPLSFFTDTDDGVQWSWYSPADGKLTTVHTFKNGPDALHADSDGQTIQIIGDGAIHHFNRDGQKLDRVIKLPAMLKDEYPMVLWRDKEDQQLRLTTWLYIRPEAIHQQGNKTLLRLPNGGTVDAIMDVEWGTHHVNRIFAYDGDWRVLHTLASKGEAGDTPGLTVIKPYFDESGASEFKLFAKKYCAASPTFYQGRICHDDPINKELRDRFYADVYSDCKRTPGGYLNERSCGAATIGKIDCPDCKFALIHPSNQGDRLHAVTPLYLLDKKTQQYHMLDLPGINAGQQITLDHAGDHILADAIGKIFTIDMKTGTVTFVGGGREAIWLKFQ